MNAEFLLWWPPQPPNIYQHHGVTRAGAFPSLVKGAASSEPCPAPVKLLPGLGSVQKSRFRFRLMFLYAVIGVGKVWVNEGNALCGIVLVRYERRAGWKWTSWVQNVFRFQCNISGGCGKVSWGTQTCSIPVKSRHCNIGLDSPSEVEAIMNFLLKRADKSFVGFTQIYSTT